MSYTMLEQLTRLDALQVIANIIQPALSLVLPHGVSNLAVDIVDSYGFTPHVHQIDISSLVTKLHALKSSEVQSVTHSSDRSRCHRWMSVRSQPQESSPLGFVSELVDLGLKVAAYTKHLSCFGCRKQKSGARSPVLALYSHSGKSQHRFTFKGNLPSGSCAVPTTAVATELKRLGFWVRHSQFLTLDSVEECLQPTRSRPVYPYTRSTTLQDTAVTRHCNARKNSYFSYSNTLMLIGNVL